jgi:hypothetical protein
MKISLVGLYLLKFSFEDKTIFLLQDVTLLLLDRSPQVNRFYGKINNNFKSSKYVIPNGFVTTMHS